MFGNIDRIIGSLVAIKTALEVPADPRWRHVIAVTVLSAVRAIQSQLERSRGHVNQASKGELSQMGDISLLLDRALDDLEGMAGVTSIIVEVEAHDEAALVTLVGAGDEVESALAPAAGVASFMDPLAGSSFAWSQSTATRSFRVPLGLQDSS